MPIVGTVIGAVVGGVVGGVAVGAAGAGITSAAAAGIQAVVVYADTMKLTAEEIFKEGDKYAVDRNKEGYITCAITYQYVANF